MTSRWYGFALPVNILNPHPYYSNPDLFSSISKQIVIKSWDTICRNKNFKLSIKIILSKFITWYVTEVKNYLSVVDSRNFLLWTSVSMFFWCFELTIIQTFYITIFYSFLATFYGLYFSQYLPRISKITIRTWRTPKEHVSERGRPKSNIVFY